MAKTTFPDEPPGDAVSAQRTEHVIQRKMDYVTLVIQKPAEDKGRMLVQQAMDALIPYVTAMSLDDEMSVLDMVINHEDFREHILEDARARLQDMPDARPGLFTR